MRIGKYRIVKGGYHGSYDRNITGRIALFRSRWPVSIIDLVQLEAHKHPLIVRSSAPLHHPKEWGLLCQIYRHIGDFAPTRLWQIDIFPTQLPSQLTPFTTTEIITLRINDH